MGNVLLGCYLVAIATAALYLPGVLVQARKERNAADMASTTSAAGDSNFVWGDLSKENGAVGVEALDTDRSVTMVNFLIGGSAENGDMELTLKDEEDATAAVPGIV